MVKKAQMEVLRALVRECLSAAAQEICRVVERIVTENEEDMSCSKWVVDNHHRLMDVDKPYSEGSLQTPASDPLPAASVNISVSWEPENTSQQTGDCPNMTNTHPDSSPTSENDRSDQAIPIDIEDVDVKQENDLNVPFQKQFQCPVCLKGFSSKRTMVRHIKKHPKDGISWYQCQFCDRHFSHKSEFIVHTRIHKGTKPYKCQDSDATFDQRDRLHVHTHEHTEEKPCQCVSDVDLHLRSGTPARKEAENGMKTFPLTITPYDRSEFDQESLQPLCLYQIQTVADIDKDASTSVPVDHIKTEPAGPDGGVSDYTTDDQLFLSVNLADPGGSRTEHKHLSDKNVLLGKPSGKPTKPFIQFEAGTPQKPYKCPCCTKCFSLTKTLIRHLRIHTEDKPYQCQFCGRNFCQKSDLVNHTRIHTGERPYQCPECHKSFAQKGNLVVHMRKHAGEKPYQCRECRCSFGQRSSLENHMKTHT